MPSVDLSKGTYTISQVFHFTQQSVFESRFDNAKRDRVKMIKVKKIVVYSPDRTSAPTFRYEIISQSTPQYKPYAPSKDKRGRYRQHQNSIKHNYDVIFIFGSDGISLNTTKWASSVGSMKVVPKKVPQHYVSQIHADTRARLKRRFKNDGKKYKEETAKIRKKGKYISDGDYIAQVLGINLDWIYRFAYAYYVVGHLYGRNYYGNVPAVKTNPSNIMAFTKHQIVVLKELMRAGILTN